MFYLYAVKIGDFTRESGAKLQTAFKKQEITLPEDVELERKMQFFQPFVEKLNVAIYNKWNELLPQSIQNQITTKQLYFGVINSLDAEVIVNMIAHQEANHVTDDDVHYNDKFIVTKARIILMQNELYGEKEALQVAVTTHWEALVYFVTVPMLILNYARNFSRPHYSELSEDQLITVTERTYTNETIPTFDRVLTTPTHFSQYLQVDISSPGNAIQRFGETFEHETNPHAIVLNKIEEIRRKFNDEFTRFNQELSEYNVYFRQKFQEMLRIYEETGRRLVAIKGLGHNIDLIMIMDEINACEVNIKNKIREAQNLVAKKDEINRNLENYKNLIRQNLIRVCENVEENFCKTNYIDFGRVFELNRYKYKLILCIREFNKIYFGELKVYINWHRSYETLQKKKELYDFYFTHCVVNSCEPTQIKKIAKVVYKENDFCHQFCNFNLNEVTIENLHLNITKIHNFIFSSDRSSATVLDLSCDQERVKSFNELPEDLKKMSTSSIKDSFNKLFSLGKSFSKDDRQRFSEQEQELDGPEKFDGKIWVDFDSLVTSLTRAEPEAQAEIIDHLNEISETITKVSEILAEIAVLRTSYDVIFNNSKASLTQLCAELDQIEEMRRRQLAEMDEMSKHDPLLLNRPTPIIPRGLVVDGYTPPPPPPYGDESTSTLSSTALLQPIPVRHHETNVTTHYHKAEDVPFPSRNALFETFHLDVRGIGTGFGTSFRGSPKHDAFTEQLYLATQAMDMIKRQNPKIFDNEKSKDFNDKVKILICLMFIEEPIARRRTKSVMGRAVGMVRSTSMAFGLTSLAEKTKKFRESPATSQTNVTLLIFRLFGIDISLQENFNKISFKDILFDGPTKDDSELLIQQIFGEVGIQFLTIVLDYNGILRQEYSRLK